MNANVTIPTLGEIRAAKTAALRDYFCGKRLRGKGANGADAVALTVASWDAIELFLAEAPTTEANPGGPDFEAILYDIAAAIEARDATRMLEGLLLAYKAVRRV